MSNTEKCIYFDKGFCKNKGQCLKKHSTTDCKGECYDKKTYPFWHTVTWKNWGKCIYLPSNACEFLHEENLPENIRYVTHIKVSIAAIKAGVDNIKKKMGAHDTAMKEKESRVSEMEI